MMKLFKGFFIMISVAGLLLAFCAGLVLAFTQDWGSFAAAYIGLAIIAVGGLGYRALDQHKA